jgi:hypothetical protein
MRQQGGLILRGDRPIFHPMKAQVRILAFSIALLAMTLRALVPAGWMPVAGSSPLILCTIEGRAHIAIDSEGQPLKQTSDQGSEHQLCPFGAAAGLALADAAMAPFSTLWSAANAPPIHFISASESLYTPHAPRAPPSFS